MNKKTLNWIMGLIGVVVLIALYFFFNPENHFFPKCIFKQLTGWDCAGCGSQRMLHALLHGDFAKAWSYNSGLIVGIPIIAIMFISSAFRDKVPRLYKFLNSRTVIIVILVGVVAWTIGRNIF
ncbi:MAG: DUF2752 domain-containing protein [Muribaculaceae bacterium]|nr:DUF2752 domain-containing protein [Muribaculaceae bacterium]MBQ3605289.1 DUF2752 domain-containing protein [Muribaculaceae bacterium]MBQ7854170.1 DUF2752 domain-containing protein [Muribaculaceae bacterium]MBR3830268.1 DUF2752 domain-containing protein [Muribaculaceae bacterium]